MPNNWESSWAEFFAKHRLRAILDEDRRHNGADREIDELGQRCFEQVVPRLLGVLESDGNSISPVLVHGDLFSSFLVCLIIDGAEMLGRTMIQGGQ